MCGNWGLICLAEFAALTRRRGETFPEGLERLLRQVMMVVELRGAQAGGLFLVLGSAGQSQSCQSHRVRVLKPKRGNLCETVFCSLSWKLWRASPLREPLRRWLPPCCGAASGTVLAQGHSRFGTSSVPAVQETHPHQWTPPRSLSFWAWVEGSGWKRRTVEGSSFSITHNGDFDAWRPYRGTLVDVGQLGLWLDRVLCIRNGASGDSAKLAGMMELLTCQGVWLHAVRYAYHLHIACHVEQAGGWRPLEPDAPHSVPNEATLRTWAHALDAEFAKLLELEGAILGPRRPLAAGGSLLEGFIEAAVLSLQLGASGQLLRRWVPDGKVRLFVEAASEAFRDNDMLAATTTFLARAEGTFGLTVASTLWPQTVVVAARGQPMSVGFGGLSAGGRPSMAVWTSEPTSLAALAKSSGCPAVSARLDLDDQHGEVLQLSVGTEHEVQAAQLSDGFAVCLEEGSGEGGATLWARGLHFGVQRASKEDWVPERMSAEAFRKRLTWLVGREGADSSSAEAASPPIPQQAVSLVAKDLVGQDLRQLPAILQEIDLCWSDEQSLNRCSADRFAGTLLQMPRGGQPDSSESRQIDLLAIGVENSLWLAQQFCADVVRLFPTLHAVAMSSNVALGLLQKGVGQLHAYNWTCDHDLRVGPGTVCLVVSHSGTTYPTVWAARFLRQRTQHVFSLSASFDCLLAVSIGQAPSEPFTQRLFSTLAGVRPAEAATVATVAMHHTLSHLLLRCAARATGVRLPALWVYTVAEIIKGAYPWDPEEEEGFAEAQEAPVRACAASAAAVHDMHRMLLSLHWAASDACGVDSRGQDLGPEARSTHDELLRAGRRWSHHITESYWATFLPAAYVLLTVVPGVLPVARLGTWLLSFWGGRPAFVDEAGVWCLRSLDALVYVFLAILVAVVHRWLTGRRLWARFTTRTLLVVELTVNYKLLRAYVSKLLALSWRFATLSVVGQNGMDHMVHEYTHKAQSDVLVAVGLPDGRLHSAASAQASILMSVQQAKFIKGRGRGIEVCALGHNPWTRAGLFRTSITLRRNRPIIASEQVLFRDQLGDTAGCCPAPQKHGLAPMALLQLWNDLVSRCLDPLDLPRVHLTLPQLQKQMAPHGRLDFTNAVALLESLLDKQREDAQVEKMPLNLHCFLQEYLAQHRSKTNVFVRSPEKQYHSPAKWNEAAKRSLSACLVDLTFEQYEKETADAQDMRSFSQRLGMPSPRGNTESNLKAWELESATWCEMEPAEFLAMLHGDELKNWVRSVRYRWGKIRKARGLLGLLTGKDEGTQDVRAAVFSGGVTLSQVLMAWKRAVPRDAKHSGVVPNRTRSSVIVASMDDAAQRRLRQGWPALRKEQMSATPSSRRRDDCRLIGQDLLDKGVAKAEVLEQSQVRELFYETRVGSAERLIAWYVLFHAMVKPSTRLPFLRYEIGKTESRLRVASTPAPVAMHGTFNHCERRQHELAVDSDTESI